LIVPDAVTNYGRVRRLANRYCFGIKTQLERLKIAEQNVNRESEDDVLGYSTYALKNDWEAMAVFLIRLRRCLLMLGKLEPDLRLSPDYLTTFDATVPKLRLLRNVEEHFDQYSLGDGDNKRVEWGQLESYEYSAGEFENGFGYLSSENANAAMLIVWEAVLSLEPQAKQLGFLSWDDRYGEGGKFRSDKT
jgi:hypothetical protein